MMGGRNIFPSWFLKCRICGAQFEARLKGREECFQDVDEETSKLMRKAKTALEKAGGLD